MRARLVPNTTAIAACVLLGALAVGGCATALPPLPYAGEDISRRPDVRQVVDAWTLTQAACRSRILTARAVVKGTLGQRSIDASFWFSVDAATDRLRLDSIDSGTARFGFLALHPRVPNGRDEGMLVASPRWVVRSQSRDLIELLLGVPLSALDMRSVLTGCPPYIGTAKFERFDSTSAKVVVGDVDPIEIYLRGQGAAPSWAVFSLVGAVPGRSTRWRADPQKRSRGVLESVRLTSLEWNGTPGRQFDVRFTFDRIQTSVNALDTFTLTIPPSASELPVDAIRRNAPVPLLLAN